MILLLLITTIFCAVPTEAEAEIYEDTVRLHILANSDSEEDQNLKLIIRDRLLEKYGAVLSSADNKADACRITEESLSDIERDAEKWLLELGYDYKVKATLGTEWYDTRDYGDFSLPSGYYTSLKIVIGKGEGKNWWCVMYPPLCNELATDSELSDDAVIDYSRAEISLIKGGRYKIKFKALEAISRLF